MTVDVLTMLMFHVKKPTHRLDHAELPGQRLAGRDFVEQPHHRNALTARPDLRYTIQFVQIASGSCTRYQLNSVL